MRLLLSWIQHRHTVALDGLGIYCSTPRFFGTPKNHYHFDDLDILKGPGKQEGKG